MSFSATFRRLQLPGLSQAAARRTSQPMPASQSLGSLAALGVFPCWVGPQRLQARVKLFHRLRRGQWNRRAPGNLRRCGDQYNLRGDTLRYNAPRAYDSAFTDPDDATRTARHDNVRSDECLFLNDHPPRSSRVGNDYCPYADLNMVMDFNGFRIFVIDVNVITNEHVAANLDATCAMQHRPQGRRSGTQPRQQGKQPVQTPPENRLVQREWESGNFVHCSARPRVDGRKFDTATANLADRVSLHSLTLDPNMPALDACRGQRLPACSRSRNFPALPRARRRRC
jgi:hypothetical protein